MLATVPVLFAFRERHKCSLAKGPKFRSQNTKGAEKSVAEFSGRLINKRAEKVPNYFVVWFCTKTVIFSAENLTSR
jgi:hypothetical protein